MKGGRKQDLSNGKLDISCRQDNRGGGEKVVKGVERRNGRKWKRKKTKERKSA